MLTEDFTRLQPGVSRTMPAAGPAGEDLDELLQRRPQLLSDLLDRLDADELATVGTVATLRAATRRERERAAEEARVARLLAALDRPTVGAVRSARRDAEEALTRATTGGGCIRRVTQDRTHVGTPQAPTEAFECPAPWAVMVGDEFTELPCDKRSCPGCGPRIRSEQAAHLLAMLGAAQLYRLPLLTARRWQRIRERIAAAGADFARCPHAADAGVILTTLEFGELVPHDQAADVIRAALDAIPAGGAVRLSTSRDWAWHPTPAVPAGAGGAGGEPPTVYAFAAPPSRVLEWTERMAAAWRTDETLPAADRARYGAQRLAQRRWRLHLPPEGTPQRRRWAMAVGRFDASDQEARRTARARPAVVAC